MHRLVDLLLPPRCPGCAREGAALCRPCRRIVGRRLDEPAGVPIGLLSSLPVGIVQLEWCSSFTGPTRAAVHALKYDGERRLAAPLADVIATRWKRAAIGGDFLVPVPVHSARRRQRGFDQAELLALEMGRRLELPVVRAIQRASATEAQHGLGRQARAGNVDQAFTVANATAGRVEGAWAVLVDDVVTTGATLGACAAALYRAGAGAVSAVCLARER